MATVQLENINKVYENGYHAIHDLSLEIQDKEFLVLVGPSGCGKSTVALAIMRDLPGIGRITKGSIKFRGRDSSMTRAARIQVGITAALFLASQVTPC